MREDLCEGWDAAATAALTVEAIKTLDADGGGREAVSDTGTAAPR